jgi:segregation and condensation protein B
MDASEKKNDSVKGNEAAEETLESLSREDTLLALHALMFASDRPVSADRLAEALGDVDREMVVTLLEELAEHVEKEGLPYSLREMAGGYQFTTNSSFAPYIRRLLQIKRKNKLSKSALETLAILAYKQPSTRAEVEAVRGVSVSHAFEVLQEKRLIKVVGVADAPGRPKLFRTTDEFLIHFGLKSLKDLPSIEELHEME